MIDEPSENHDPHAVIAGTEIPQPGDIVIDPDLAVVPEPLVGSGRASELEDATPGPLPQEALVAMKDRRHSQWGKILTGEVGDDLELIIGEGKSTVYVIGDRKHHAMISRLIGTSTSCTYVLVGRITMDQLNELVNGSLAPQHAFDAAAEIEVVGVAILPGIATANIIEVARYEDAGFIPAEYRVGHALHHFARDLEITEY